eukprot:Hpha_TRINITY_DN34274_c0_g1::TRINITY_DN34274_c0_g1_i1::g.34459::m.34459
MERHPIGSSRATDSSDGEAPVGGLPPLLAKQGKFSGWATFIGMHPITAGVILIFPSRVRTAIDHGNWVPFWETLAPTLVMVTVFIIASLVDPGFVRIAEDAESRSDEPWCSVCKHGCPPRAVHCKSCNRCVARWDHHCPFLGQCVGARNHKWFLAFLGIGAYTMFVVSCELFTCLTYRRTFTWAQVFTKNGFPCLLMLMCAFMGLIAAVLFPFHLFLGSTNQTSRELFKTETCWYLRKRPSPSGRWNQYDKGLVFNMKEWLTANGDTRWRSSGERDVCYAMV